MQGNCNRLHSTRKSFDIPPITGVALKAMKLSKQLSDWIVIDGKSKKIASNSNNSKNKKEM
jgi:hypothetical protein